MLKSQPGGIQQKAEAAVGIINILEIFMSAIKGSFLILRHGEEERKRHHSSTSSWLGWAVALGLVDER